MGTAAAPCYLSGPMTASERLNKILSSGPIIDIMHAEEALSVIREISKHREDLIRTTHALPFKTLQSYAADGIILAVTRLFEIKSPRSPYELNSLPEALNLFAKSADELVMAEPAFLKEPLKKLGLWSSALLRLPERDRVLAIASYLRTVLPSPDTDAALNALKEARDKALSHREAIDPDKIGRTTWSEVERLILTAKLIVATLVGPYCSMGYMLPGEGFGLTEDMNATGFSVSRLASFVVEHDKR